MNIRTYTLAAGLLTLTVALAARADDPPPDPTPPGVEVQARGPVHEAFAQPNENRPMPSVVIAKKPPDPIDEIPPDQKPEGDNVVWVPGYWSWDEDMSDFLWVSGFWRVPPPSRHWVPGNWQQVEDGWQWAAGFWAADNAEQFDYVPAPPPSLDSGPQTPAPDDNAVYAPGSWVWREKRYYWRPGFWVDFRPGWVWIPAHYVWTPAGYVFVDGYWDHPLEERGLLFAPVRIDPKVVTPRWTYTPYYVVQPDFLVGALFVRLNHCHYYFGDYFEDRYKERGYVTWFDHRPTKGVFDPNFAYYQHRFTGDPAWERNLRELYADRYKGAVPRPPRTLVLQNTAVKNITVNKIENVAVTKNINITHRENVTALAPVTRINNTKVTNLSSLGTGKATVKVESHVIKTEVLPKGGSAEVHKAVTDYRKSVQVRHDAEAKILHDGGAPVKVTDTAKSVKITVPKAPAPPKVERPKPLPVKEVPKPPAIPKHEEKAIPAHEPPKPAKPPKK
jgi:hypothetical protein